MSEKANRVSRSESASNLPAGDLAKILPQGPAINSAAQNFQDLMGTRAPSQSESQIPHTPLQERTETRERPDDQPADESQGKSDDKPKDEKKTESQPSPGDAILQSMTRSATPITGSSEAKPSGPATLDSVVQEVANQLLVSATGTGREVRITIKNSILPGTQVSVSQQGGKMQIQFVCNSKESIDLLAQHQQVLQDRLSSKLTKHDVVVSISTPEGPEGEANDGRSRQRRDLIDEQENEQ